MTRRGRHRRQGHRPLSANRRPLRAESLEPRLALAAPEAVGEQFSVLFGELAVGGRGVLSNDSDADGDALSVVLSRGPSNGSVALDAGGSFRYLPRPNFRGTDSFDYRALGGGEESAVATVTITVQNKMSVQEWPVAAGGNGHAYSAFQAPWNAGFDVARLLAEGLIYRGSPGHLTTLTSAAESQWAVENRALFDDILLGAYQDKTSPDYAEPAGGWRWVTSEPMAFTAWNPGEPNNLGGEDYVQVWLNGPNLTWNDIGNWSGATYSVEFDAPQAFAGDDLFSVDRDQALEVAAGKLLANDLPSAGTLPSLAIVSSPAHGAVSFGPDGSFRYTPAPGFIGRDRFAYKLISPQGESNAATVELRVGRDDYPTVATYESYYAQEDTPLETARRQLRSVLANDTDLDGQPLHAVLATPPEHGTIELLDNGHFIYTPSPEYSGLDRFEYRATDGHSFSMPQLVELTIYSVDDPTQTAPDAYVVPASGPLTVSAAAGVLANDVDIDSAQLFANVERFPLYGDLTWNSNGSFTYSPRATFRGSDYFYYSVNGAGATIVHLLSSLSPDRPTALADQYWADTTDAPLVVPAEQGLLSNDFDAQRDPLHAVLVGAPAHGSLSLADDGSFSYIPKPGFVGIDSFWYQATDGLGDSAPTRVDLETQSGPPPIPFVADDVALYLPGSELVVTASAGPLSNDVGLPEGRRVQLVQGPTHGLLTLQADGAYSYTPATGFAGHDRFRYRVLAGDVEVGQGEVWLKPVVENLAPVTSDDHYSVDEDASLSVGAAGGILANDADWDGSLALSVVTGPPQGTLEMRPDGSFSYHPKPDFAGVDRFVYRVVDAYGVAAQATATIDVRPVNDPPLAAPDFYLVGGVAALHIPVAQGVLANDVDIDSAHLSLNLIEKPQHGELALSADGSFVYTPDSTYNGADAFRYFIGDGSLESPPVRVLLTKELVGASPVAIGEHAVVAQHSSAVLQLLTNEYSSPGDQLQAILIRQPRHGRASLADSGALTYVPDPDFEGLDTLFYVVRGDAGESNAAEVTIEVLPGNIVDNAFIWSADEGGNGHAYWTMGRWHIDWNESKRTAEEAVFHGSSGHLATITSAAEEQWIEHTFTFSANRWIGGYQDPTLPQYREPDGGWAWVTGEPWSYTNWALGEPNDWNAEDQGKQSNYLMHDGRWDDAPLRGGNHDEFIVEFPGPFFASLSTADDTYTSPANQPIEIAAGRGVLVNDRELPTNSSATLVAGPLHGALDLAADGSFRYVPESGYRGRDRFTYKVVGPSGETNSATVWLNTGTNDLPPELSDVEYHVGQNGVLVAESKSNERDLYSPFDGPDLPPEFEGDRFGVVGGVVKRVNWEYDRYNRWLRTRRADYRTLDFSYEVTFNTEFAKETDLYGASLIGLGSGTFIDGATGRELIDSLFLRFSRADRNNGIVQLENQWGQPLATLGSIKQAGVHRARIEKLGDQVTFSIDVAYNGVFQADLSYTVPSLSAAVPKLTNANTRLFMVSSVGTDWFDDVAIVSLPRHGLREAAADPEGGAFAFRVIESPAHGDLALNRDGTFRYVPAPGFVGVDRFRYTADDGPLTSNPATVTVVVEPQPAAPLAVADVYTVAQDGRLDVGGPWTSIRRLAIRTAGTIFDPTRGLLWAADPDSYAIRSIDPATGALGQRILLQRFNYIDDANYPNGPLALSGNGAFLYVTATERTLRVELATGRVEELFTGRARSLVSRPGAADEIAADGVIYRNGVRAFNLYDYWNVSVSAAAYSPDGQRFVGYNGGLNVSTAEGEDYAYHYLGQNPPASTLTWSRDRLVFAASDLVIDANTFAVLGNLPQRGTNVVDSARDRIYTLRENRIYVIDSRSLALRSTLTVPDAPTVGNSGLIRWGADGLAFQGANGQFFVLECNTLDGPRGQGVADNDRVSSTEATVVGLLESPQHGVLALNPDGAFRYEPAAGYVGQDRFVYRLSNSLGASQATVLLNVAASASAPRTREDSYAVWQQQTLLAGAEVGLLANDADRDSRQLRVKSIVGPSHGALRWQADGSFSYEPESGYSGPDSFQYIASDGHFDAAPTTAYLQVRPAQFEVQLRAVHDRTGADRVTVLPDSISGAAPGDEIYVELWLQDRDPATPWYQLGTFDLSYSADVLTLLGINDGPIFGNPPPGTIDELGPREADLYGAPGWGKMATLHFRVHGLGPSSVSLVPGHYFFSAPWQEVAWSNLSLGTFAGDSNYDNRVDLTDFGVVKNNFGLPSGATAWQGDFDGNGRVDLADFGVLKENFGQEAIGAAPQPASLSAISEPEAVSARAVDLLLANERPPADSSQPSDLLWLAWERRRFERDER